MTKKNLIGLTGNRAGYNEPGDTNWAQNINYTIKTIAESLDKFEYGINDIARETEAAAGRRFQELQDALAEFVIVYTVKISSEKDIAYTHLKQYIEDRLAVVANGFVEASAKDLASTIAIKNMIENQIVFIEENIQFLKKDFDYNLDLFNTKIDTAKNQRDAVLTTLKTDITAAETILKAHIAEKKTNPHKTKLSQLINYVTVYQIDKDNPTSLIEPAFVVPSVNDTVDSIDSPPVIDSNADFLGKVIGLGNYLRDLTDGLIGTHYYLEFDPALSTLIDSLGETADYYITGNIIIIEWTSGSKLNTTWEVGLDINSIQRLNPVSISVKATNSSWPLPIRVEEVFLLYIANDPYPDLLAQFLGIASSTIFVDNTSATDADANWSVDIQNTPADWDDPLHTPVTPSAPDYWIQALDIEPTVSEKKSVEGP